MIFLSQVFSFALNSSRLLLFGMAVRLAVALADDIAPLGDKFELKLHCDQAHDLVRGLGEKSRGPQEADSLFLVHEGSILRASFKTTAESFVCVFFSLKSSRIKDTLRFSLHFWLAITCPRYVLKDAREKYSSAGRVGLLRRSR